MAEYSKMASGRLFSPGSPTSVIVPFKPEYIEISNSTSLDATPDGVSRAWWDKDMGQGAAFVTTTASGHDLTTYVAALGGADGTTGTTAGTGFTVVDGGISLQYGPVYQHTGSTDFSITTSSNPTITTTTAHNLVTGDVVIFQDLYQTSTTGMPQICGIPFKVTVFSTTTFSIGWDTSGSNYTAFNTATSTGNVGSFKKVLYPSLYVPGKSVLAISPQQQGNQTIIYTTIAHNFVIGQEVGFRIPSIWGLNQLNSLPDGRVPGSSRYARVTLILSEYAFLIDVSIGNLTPFNQNIPVSKVPGLSFPIVYAVGDVTTGSSYYGYSSPLYNSNFALGYLHTNNGPAVDGAYINATLRAFILGSSICGNSQDVIEWRAYASDINT